MCWKENFQSVVLHKDVRKISLVEKKTLYLYPKNVPYVPTHSSVLQIFLNDPERKQRCSLLHDKKAVFHINNLRPALHACMESETWGWYCITHFGNYQFKRWLLRLGRKRSTEPESRTLSSAHGRSDGATGKMLCISMGRGQCAVNEDFWLQYGLFCLKSRKLWW